MATNQPAETPSPSKGEGRLTDQQIFDKALRGVIAQGCLSLGDGNCVYRDGYGHACGIGQLIADDDYLAVWDKPGGDTDVATLFYNDARFVHALNMGGVFFSDTADDMLPLLRRIQEAHDGASVSAAGAEDQLDSFRRRMKLVATEFGIVYAEPEVKA